MKKYLSFFLCLAVAIAFMMVSAIHGLAAEDGITLPEFEYPTASYSTFAETGIPYDELFNLFPETLEIKYENGTLFVKDLGGDNASLTDHLNYDSYEGQLVDGYWTFEISSDAYNSGGTLSMFTDSHSWHAQYDISGKRGVISFTGYSGRKSRIIVLYPAEGYGDQFVNVIYDLLSGIRVSDTYKAGYLVEQAVEIHNNTSSYWANYDSQGEIKSIDIYRYDTGKYSIFLPGAGWSEENSQYIPTDAPAGYEDATLESLKALGPTDIGCKHQWEGPLCDAPAICALCMREKGVPTGHSWVSGSEYDTCSTCNGILYRFPKIDMPSFEGHPYINLDNAGIDIDAITSKLLQKVKTKYENGTFMIPNMDGYSLDARLKSKGYVDYLTENGWNLIKVAEEDLAALRLTFSKEEKLGKYSIGYNLTFDANGSLLSFSIFDWESGKSFLISLEENSVELSYYKEKEGTIEYTDVYKNGDLVSQLLCDNRKLIWVYYDSELNVAKVRLWNKGRYVSLIPGKDWTVDGTNGETVPAPEGYEDKDIAYFAATYPHIIDFCIHSYEIADDGSYKKCVKCGDTIELKEDTDYSTLVIVLVLVGTALAVAVTVGIIVSAKKKKNSKVE